MDLENSWHKRSAAEKNSSGQIENVPDAVRPRSVVESRRLETLDQFVASGDKNVDTQSFLDKTNKAGYAEKVNKGYLEGGGVLRDIREADGDGKEAAAVDSILGPDSAPVVSGNSQEGATQKFGKNR